MTMYFDASMIIDDIWVGSYEAARNVAMLKKKGFSAVLNVSLDDRMFSEYPHDWRLLHFPLYDGDAIPAATFREAIDFLVLCRSERRRTLLHCAAGVSRSVTIMAAYLMKIKGMSPADALLHIMERRPEAAPATYTFNSAVMWVYGKTTFLCRTCQKKWRYTADYIYRYEGYGYLAETGHETLCQCEHPQLEIN